MKKLILLILCITILSCSTEEFIEGEKLVIPDKNALNSIALSSELKSDDHVFGINSQVKTSTISEEVLNGSFLKLNIKSLSIQTVILYSNNIDINGIGIYYYSNIDKNYYFDLFSFNKSSNIFEKEKSYLSNILLVRELFYFQSNYFNGNKIDILYIENYKKQKTKQDYSDLTLDIALKALKSLSKNKNSSKTDLERSLELKNVACGIVGNCLRGNGSCAAPSFVCMKPIECPAEKTQSYASSRGYSVENILLSNYDSFRDSFLMKSELGREYVGLFYAISDHFNEALNVGILLKILNALPEINEAIDNLSNPQFNGVIITESLKLKVVDIINSIKNNSSSSIFIQVLNNFRNDFIFLSLKTKTEIYNAINFEG